MVDKILELVNIESKDYKEQKGEFNLEFYENIDVESLRKKTKIICELYSYEFTDDIFKSKYQMALRRHKATTPVTIKESTVLKVNANPWLTDQRKVEIGWISDEVKTYRERYFKYLEKLGRTEKILEETRRSTLNIVGNLGDPKSTEGFYKKAMVVGSVQSGKTANFNGVINTAIDSGYKMVIVLSGIMEDLRVQTQARIEKEVIGTLGAGAQGIGVGKDHPFTDNIVMSVTSGDSDFKRALLDAKFNINSKNILVVKKNVSILKNILLWLNEFVNENHPKIDIPLLIIDDEADNASLNNLGHKGSEYATETNKRIRAILAMFSKKSYLGYTATPFANVFQDRNESPVCEFKINHSNKEYQFELVDNLFPDDFIELLYPPSNYVGIKHFFDTKSDKISKIESLIADPIDFDDEEYYNCIPPRIDKESNEPASLRAIGTRAAKKDDEFPNSTNGLPKSLKEAIHCFILSIAIRDSRKSELEKTPFYQPHHTMLVHISLFGLWQNRLQSLIADYVGEIKKDLSHDALDLPVWLEFERVWNKHYYHVVNNIKHELPENYEDDYLIPKDFKVDIIPLLNNAIRDIEIVAINSITGTDLDYKKNPKKYIAVGGNRLSRGFTLEGLTINYFLRKANTADTLMQMGRWFGYRIGYLDCCKLFTTSDNIEKFNEASKIIEDLENQFEYLSTLPGRTPSDFTLWVRNNPDVIKLTRGNFLKGLTVKSLSFEDTVEQSTQFNIDRDKLEESFNSFNEKIENIEWSVDENHPNYIVHDTDQDGLMEFINLPNTMLNLNTLGLKEYLDTCSESRKLRKWRIAINVSSNNTGGDISLPIEINKTPLSSFKKITRSGPDIGKIKGKSSLAYKSLIFKDTFKARNSTIITPSDFSLTLSRDEIKGIKDRYKISDPGKSVPDKEYRAHMDDSTGILVIYLMDLAKVFNVKNNEYGENLSLEDYAANKGLDSEFQKNIPLIGYALGFPTNIGVNGEDFVSQHVFKEPKDMTLDELKEYVIARDFDIDTVNDDWTKESLLSEMYDEDSEKIEEAAISDMGEF